MLETNFDARGSIIFLEVLSLPRVSEFVISPSLAQRTPFHNAVTMRVTSLLLPFLIAGTVTADSTIESICSGIKNVYGCTANMEVPTGAKSKLCRNKFFEVSATN